MYRNADYDINYDRLSIASFPEGLKEEVRYLPYNEPPVRRTNSCDDIARFYRCFNLAQSNQGNGFTWHHYLSFFKIELKSFKFSPTYQKLMSKVPSSSEFSFVTARQTSTPNGMFRFRKKYSSKSPRSSPEVSKSSSSLSSNVGNHVLKVCSDTKNLAKDIYKKMEKISNLHGSRKNSKERRRHGAVDIIGDAHSPCRSPSLASRGESTDNDSGSASPLKGAGDRRKRLVVRSRLCH
ncbi:uncharacterized protein [Parasteatoda tepidariorum]|uniref:uncharacterized protein n=1 Tax=Parasteatoda tepidariorum TaxID=114398 RepID=UPI00077F8FE2|nr:uncharacterized protein LOC107436157 [Parasteatoda tepidariorum]